MTQNAILQRRQFKADRSLLWFRTAPEFRNWRGNGGFLSEGFFIPHSVNSALRLPIPNLDSGRKKPKGWAHMQEMRREGKNNDQRSICFECCFVSRDDNHKDRFSEGACMRPSGKYRSKIIYIVWLRFTLVDPSISSNHYLNSDGVKIFESEVVPEIIPLIAFLRPIVCWIVLYRFEKSARRGLFWGYCQKTTKREFR